MSDEDLYDLAKVEGGESFPIAWPIVCWQEKVRQGIPRSSRHDTEAISRSRGYQRGLSVADRNGETHRLSPHLSRLRQGPRH